MERWRHVRLIGSKHARTTQRQRDISDSTESDTEIPNDTLQRNYGFAPRKAFSPASRTSARKRAGRARARLQLEAHCSLQSDRVMTVTPPTTPTRTLMSRRTRTRTRNFKLKNSESACRFSLPGRLRRVGAAAAESEPPTFYVLGGV